MPRDREMVINTGPLIALTAALGDLRILERLYARVVVPFEVQQEILTNNATQFGAGAFREAVWLEKRDQPIEITPLLRNVLDRGEAAVIHTAQTKGIPTVCIDEEFGRQVARLNGLHVTGSLGVLIRARNENYPIVLRQAIADMRARGVWISHDLELQVLEMTDKLERP